MWPVLEKAARVVRADEWYDSKLTLFVLATLSQMCRQERGAARDSLTILVTTAVFAASYLAFGYAFNDYCDRANDRAAGKPNGMDDLAHSTQLAVLCILSSIGIAALICSRGPAVLWLAGAAAYASAITYSAPVVRLKERGVIGLISSAAAQRVFPLGVLFCLVRVPVWSAVAISLLYLFIGIRWILVHQLIDRERDRASGTRTFVTTHRDGWIENAMLACFACESLTLCTILLLAACRSPVSVMALVAPYALFQIYLADFWRKVGWRRIMYSYDFAPLADLYFLWCPTSLVLFLAMRDIMWTVVVPAVVMLGWRYVRLDWRFVQLRREFSGGRQR